MKIVEYISYIMMPALIVIILLSGEKKKVLVYDCFIEGASEAFSLIIKIFPSMLAIVVAINIFKVSGTMDALTKLISPITSLLNVPPEVVPIGVLRSVSGGGAIAVLTDVLKNEGPDSLLRKNCINYYGI